MLIFPTVPYWWMEGTKFMQLGKGFHRPDFIVGYDTETCRGEIITQQYVSHNEKKLVWCNTDNALDKFFDTLETMEGFIVIYCFNAHFDLAVTFRRWIEFFVRDDFEVKYRGWTIRVFCSGNWFAVLKNGKRFVYFLDIMSYFKGNLATVSKSFNLEEAKLKAPVGLGYKKFSYTDKRFKAYAMMDALLCFQMGCQIIDMHEEYDVPISSSSANFAEKVFRRNFIRDDDKIEFPPYGARRMAEITYHGGKNAYYLTDPHFIEGCYEYDFNSAYPYAMLTLPSFVGGKYKMVKTLIDDKVGVYTVVGKIKACPYGILYNTAFKYYRNVETRKQIFVTSYELIEAIQSGEFELERVCMGWVWEPAKLADHPLANYVSHFWQKKQKEKKGTVQYEFTKLLLNSLYGKWIQRNPIRQPFDAKFDASGKLTFNRETEVAGGLYNPFIATLITGNTRARLHTEEHRLDAIEVSTDSVKSRKKYTPYINSSTLGGMQLERHKCKTCDSHYDKFDGLFIRNRLNLLMCPEKHVMKSALHGFVGTSEHLKQLWEDRETEYSVERMAQVREGLRQGGKPLFQMFSEWRKVNIDWSAYVEITKSKTLKSSAKANGR